MRCFLGFFRDCNTHTSSEGLCDVCSSHYGGLYVHLVPAAQAVRKRLLIYSKHMFKHSLVSSLKLQCPFAYSRLIVAKDCQKDQKTISFL